MKALRRFARRLVASVLGHRDEERVREELTEHLTLLTDEYVHAGVPIEEARRRAKLKLGVFDATTEAHRDEQRLRWLEDLGSDLRYGLRTLRRTPGFTVIAIVTLALGIGANTAVFSLLNSLVLRPLPVRDPDRLALITNGAWSYPLWEQIRARENELFDGALAWSAQRFDLSEGGLAAPVDGAYVSGRFFDVLGVSAERGRALTPADDSASAPDGPVAVISHRYWRAHFGGADDVVGRRIIVQRVPFTVVGVMPAAFFGVDVGQTTDVIVPIRAESIIRGSETWLRSAGASWLEIMVRLKPGQSLDRANDVLRGAEPTMRAAIGGNRPTDPLILVPAAAGKSDLRTTFETPLVAMVVAVGLVLLVACANVAGLAFERAVARRHELGVRLALGGSRARLARLVFSESLIVAVTGAMLGLAFAVWSSALLVQRLNTWRNTISLDLGIDWRVLAFTTMLACVSAVVAGLAPVLGVKRVAPSEALRNAGRTITGDRRFIVRGTLVVAQIAVSLVLVTAAGLFLRTFASLNQLPLGFAPAPLLLAELDLQRTPPEARGPLVERLRDAVTTIPGVNAVAVSTVRPLTGGGWGDRQVVIGDGPMGRYDRSQPILWMNATTPGWFRTMGMAMKQGRDFEAGDRVGGVPVAIVNEAFVRQYLSGHDAIGQTVRLGFDAQTRREIIGVVSDAVYTSPRDGMTATMYVPMAQQVPDGLSVAVLTLDVERSQRATAERDIAAALLRVDPAVEFTFRTFDQLVDATVTQERLVAMLSGFFGAFALLLASIGLYGIVAQAVRARRAEIGLRMALGAQPAGIMRLVFHRIGVLIAAGLAIGLGISLWAARFVAPLLFHVEARDPATFITAAATLVAVGALAVWVPARRAARLDPATVLREG